MEFRTVDQSGVHKVDQERFYSQARAKLCSHRAFLFFLLQLFLRKIILRRRYYPWISVMTKTTGRVTFIRSNKAIFTCGHLHNTKGKKR